MSLQNYLQSQEIYNDFNNQQPFPHLIIDNFLHEEVLMELIKATYQEEFFEKESDLFHFLQTNDIVSSNNKVLQNFRTFLSSNEFVEYMNQITGLNLKINAIDLQGSVYQDTHFLLCHDDQLDDRKLAFILYLTDLEENEGGALNLLDKEGNIIKSIQPKANRFACFTVSNDSLHEVTEVLVEKDRLTLNGWLK